MGFELSYSSTTRGWSEEIFIQQHTLCYHSVPLSQQFVTLYCIFIRQILILNVFVADKQRLYQKAGFITRGNRATCTPDGGKANTTMAKLKGHNRYQIIFYGC